MSAVDAVDGSSTGIQVPDRACYSITAHVAYWHFADIDADAEHVRSWR
jgi:hypothetical protein